MTGTDGVRTEISSDNAFPYQMFDVAVPAGAGDDTMVRVSWAGSANAADAKVLMYALNTATGSWEELDRHLTIGEGATTFGLEALIPTADHVSDGSVRVLVQHSEGFAGTDLSTRESDVEPRHPEDTPRAEYDFPFGWESDTQ